MKLRDVIRHLCAPDFLGKSPSWSKLMDCDVVFNDIESSDMELLSVYMVNGVVNVDIGETMT